MPRRLFQSDPAGLSSSAHVYHHHPLEPTAVKPKLSLVQHNAPVVKTPVVETNPLAKPRTTVNPQIPFAALQPLKEKMEKTKRDFAQLRSELHDANEGVKNNQTLPLVRFLRRQIKNVTRAVSQQ